MTEIISRIKRLGRKRRTDAKSIYSVVSCRDLTPGSLEVWIDLPDEIKFDPSLEPFKRLYEQNLGKGVDVEEDGQCDKGLIENNSEVSTVEECVRPQEESDKNNGKGFVQSLKSNDGNLKSIKSKKIERSLRIIKLTALVASWAILTVSLLLHKEKENVSLHTSVADGQVKEYTLDNSDSRVAVEVTLTGPFVQQDSENTSNRLYAWLERNFRDKNGSEYQQNSTNWIIYMPSEERIDFAPSAQETKILVIENNQPVYNSSEGGLQETAGGDWKRDFGGGDSTVTLCISSTSNSTVPLAVSYLMDPLEERYGIIYAIALLLILYSLIIFEVVNRTIAALLTSTLGVAVLAFNGMRPSLPQLVSWLDVETLLLLFSMMLLVAILAETGLFDHLAVLAFDVTGGRTWPLINCLCFFTALFSTFLDNVTTVLLMTPVTIRLCEVMQLNPIPILMSMVIFSNVGGTATPVGDPPNVIIASHPAVLRANINFGNFTLHMGLGIILVCVQTYFQLRYIFRDMNKLKHNIPNEIQELRQEIFVWKRAAASLSSYSRDEDIVRKALEKKIERLNNALAKREAGKCSKSSDSKFSSTLAQLKQKYKIRDKALLIKSVICVSFVIVVFFLHSVPQFQGLSLGWTAFLGALLLFLLAERDDLEPVLARVEWSTLLFFAALFILMEVLSKLSLISWIGKLTESIILKVSDKFRLLVAILLILWVSGLASAFVDNIPLTTMMVRVIAALADPNGLNLTIAPLAWALSFGACLGGNGTLIGASANVVCAGVAEQHGYRFTFLQYLKIGFPVMMGNLVVASIYLLLCHCAFQWH